MMQEGSFGRGEQQEMWRFCSSEEKRYEPNFWDCTDSKTYCRHLINNYLFINNPSILCGMDACCFID